jgi:hypothetical protein
LQLSRLGIPSAKEVSAAIPTLLTLRQGSFGGGLRLEPPDLKSDSQLSLSLRSLFPSFSSTQIRFALCEWYHDLYPELQLNSAKFKLPSAPVPVSLLSPSSSNPSPQINLVNIKKRKNPTDFESTAPAQVALPTPSRPPFAASNLSSAQENTLAATSRPINGASEGLRGDNSENGATAAPTHGFPMTPHPHLSKRVPTVGVSGKVSGSRRRRVEMNVLAQTHLDEHLLDDDAGASVVGGAVDVMDDDTERDPTYEDGKPMTTIFSSPSRSIKSSSTMKSQTERSLQSDGWRHEGPRPKKQAKRSSLDAVGFIHFSKNTLKERTTLADDDFAGTEMAYFADIYAPQPVPLISPLPPSESSPLSSHPAPSSSSSSSNQFVKAPESSGKDSQEKQERKDSPKPAYIPDLNPSSKESSNSLSRESSNVGKGKLEGIQAMELMKLFTLIRGEAIGLK